jgi:inner membrane protein
MRSYTHIASAIFLFVVFAFVADFNNVLTGIFFASWISVFPNIIDKITGKHRGMGHSIFWLIPLAIVSF